VDHPGIYKGQCSQICGKEHGYMPITVVAKSEADYAAWVNEQKKKQAASAEDPTRAWTLDELKAKGALVFAANCQVCHQANGTGVPGAFPAVNGSKVVLGAKVDEISLVLKGKNAMPAWGSQLDDSEIAAVITYTRNAWDNKTGEAIQPGEIKAARS
jgi:cytochrome c oxidase subunit 2